MTTPDGVQFGSMGTVHFFCAAENCSRYAQSDVNIFCPEHASEPAPKVRHGYTVEQWRRLIAEQRKAERQSRTYDGVVTTWNKQ